MVPISNDCGTFSIRGWENTYLHSKDRQLLEELRIPENVYLVLLLFIFKLEYMKSDQLLRKTER